MKEYFEQYRRSGEEYQSPGFAYKNDEKVYHMGIYVKGGMANGYALYTDFPVTEDEKLNAVKMISGMLVSIRRIHNEYKRKARVNTAYFKDARTAINKWAKTYEEKEMAARYEEYMDVILGARQRFLDEYQRMADLQKQLFQKGYFDNNDKQLADSIIINSDAALFVLMKRLKDDFEKNKALLSYVEKNRNRLGYFKYRVLVKNLSTSTLDVMDDYLNETVDGLNTIWDEAEWSHIPPVLASIEHPQLRKQFASSLVERDENLIRQVREKLRN